MGHTVLTAIRATLDLLTVLSDLMKNAFVAAQKAFATFPERVKWSAAAGPHGTGLLVWPAWETEHRNERFIPWVTLRPQLHSALLPRLLADPRGYRFDVGPHHGKQDWLMHLVEPTGSSVADVWLGVNPEKGWEHDGLVHIGSAVHGSVWQTYRRLSNGAYERLASRYRTLEEVPAARETEPFTA